MGDTGSARAARMRLGAGRRRNWPPELGPVQALAARPAGRLSERPDSSPPLDRLQPLPGALPWCMSTGRARDAVVGRRRNVCVLLGFRMTLRKWLQPPEVPPVEPIEAAPIGRLSDLPRESGEVPQESANPSGLPADNSEGNSFQPANPRGRHRHVRRRDGQVAEKLACVKG